MEIETETPTEQPGIGERLHLFVMMAAGIILLIMHQVLRSDIPKDLDPFTYLAGFLGLAMAIVAITALDKGHSPAWLESFFQKICAWARMNRLQVVAFILAILFTLTASLASGPDDNLYNAFIAVCSWGFSIGLIILAGWERKPASPRTLLKPLAWALGLFVLAFLLRGIDTTHYPNVLSGDESSSGLYSLGFISGVTNNIFRTGWYSFPSLYFFIQSYGIRLFGQTTPGLRVFSAIAGALTVSTLYLVVRAMFGNRAGIIAGILLSFSHFHINFSRIGLNNIWDGLGFVVAIGALYWAWTRERRAAFVLAGLAAGLSQYFYTSSHAILAVMGGWLVLVLLQDRKKFVRLLPDLILMAGAMLVTLLPLVVFFIQHPNTFFEPMNRVTTMGDWLSSTMSVTGDPAWKIMLNQFITALLSFTDRNLTYWYTPQTAMLRQNLAWAFYIGITLMIIRFKDSRNWMTFLWLLVFVVLGATSDSTPAAQRYVASIPACIIVVAYAMDSILAIIIKFWPKLEKTLVPISLVVIFLVAANDAYFYFYEYTPRSDFGGHNTLIAQRLADYLHSYDSSWQVMFSGAPQMGYGSIPSLYYLDPQIKGVDLITPWNDPNNPRPEKKNVIFVFLPDRPEDYSACKQAYPGGEVVTEYDNRGELLYVLYKTQLK
jgi:4-amino-4-deoxy-L-arabinose transferase-like glycosyltransferase